MKAIQRKLLSAAVAAIFGLSGGVVMADEQHAEPDHHAKEDAKRGGSHWEYGGEAGPIHWGGLAEEFKTCGTGKSQSPIDISTTTVTTLSDIEVHYNPAPLSIVNNGHTVQVNFPEGNYIDVSGKKYALLQYHFHTNSEHTLGGKSFPMEAHFVHKSEDGQLGVIGVFLKEGGENQAIKAVWENMPKESASVEKADITINPADLLPKNLSYFNYSGSLTTPPCSEGVNWMVMTAPVEVSPAQVTAFAGIVTKNNRPVQPVNGRVVSLGN